MKKLVYEVDVFDENGIEVDSLMIKNQIDKILTNTEKLNVRTYQSRNRDFNFVIIEIDDIAEPKLTNIDIECKKLKCVKSKI